VPEELAGPERFAPTPWETYTYGANDNAGRTHPVAARGYEHHWSSPACALVDALGRTIETAERDRGRHRPGQLFRHACLYHLRSSDDTVDLDDLRQQRRQIVELQHVGTIRGRPIGVGVDLHEQGVAAGGNRSTRQVGDELALAV
jgi:hypothetical protein